MAFRLLDYINDSDPEPEPAPEPPLEVIIEPPPPDLADIENLVIEENRRIFRDEFIYKETNIFTAPQSTTNTMEGFLSNVAFHEQELIKILVPNEHIVMCRCNYGKVVHPNYVEPVKEKKSNRGRRKKEKRKKLRKKQGDGLDFNSQITFVVQCASAKVYKFKVFRTGKLQLPGVRQNAIDDVIECIGKLAQYLSGFLKEQIEVVCLNPVMKNYKLAVKLRRNHIIDMEKLKAILLQNRTLQFGHPEIFMVKYTRQDTKLSIKFSTPIKKNEKKKTRINIFMRGKINILGAFDTKTTSKICEYLHYLFDKYYDELVVPEGVLEEYIENIEPIPDDEFRQMIFDYIHRDFSDEQRAELRKYQLF